MQSHTPTTFASDVLGLTMWSKFSAVFEAVAAGKRRILVRSANGVGKTTALAALCNWKLFTCDECIVVTTSSSEKQLRNNLWGEIRRQAARAKLYEPDAITDTRIKLDEKRFMIGVSPAKPESAQGYHAASMLIAIDEATGVRRDIISSLLATATGDDVQIVMIYNPMSTDSFVYEAERSGEWEVITISAFEHPNMAEEKNIIPGAVTVTSTEDRLAMWSFEVDPETDDSFLYKDKWWRRTLEVSRRLFGQWFERGGEGLIPKYLLDRSLTTEAEPGEKTMGVDVGRGGDDMTVISRFDGGIQQPLRVMYADNLHDIAAAIKQEYDAGYTRIAIDETGVGAGLTDLLDSLGIKVASINFSQRTTRTFDAHHRTLANARIEMYYNLLEELKVGKIRLLDDKKLHEDLMSVRLSEKVEGNRYFLEAKDKVRRRLARSPDRGDATVLARYAPLVAIQKRKLL